MKGAVPAPHSCPTQLSRLRPLVPEGLAPPASSPPAWHLQEFGLKGSLRPRREGARLPTSTHRLTSRPHTCRSPPDTLSAPLSSELLLVLSHWDSSRSRKPPLPAAGRGGLTPPPHSSQLTSYNTLIPSSSVSLSLLQELSHLPSTWPHSVDVLILQMSKLRLRASGWNQPGSQSQGRNLGSRLALWLPLSKGAPPPGQGRLGGSRVAASPLKIAEKGPR